MKLFQILKNELAHILQDTAILLTIFGGVVLYAFLYPQPYINESVSEIAVGVVDYDQSKTSRDILFMLDAAANVDIVMKATNEDALKKAFSKGLIKGVIIIPKHFQRDFLLGNTPHVSVAADGNYFLVLGAVAQSALETLLTLSAQHKVHTMIQHDVSFLEATHHYTPFEVKFVELFNEGGSYLQYVIPAVFVLILQQTMLIGLGILGGSTNEQLSRRKDFYVCKTNTFELMFVRAGIFIGIFAVHVMFYFGYMYLYYDISFMADIVALSAFVTMFLVSVSMLGIFLGALFRAREIATPLVLFSSLPLIFSVGFIWPLEMIPQSITMVSSLIPSTPAISGFLKLNQMGASLGDLGYEMTLLGAQSLFYGVLGYLTLRWRKKAKCKGE